MVHVVEIASRLINSSLAVSGRNQMLDTLPMAPVELFQSISCSFVQVLLSLIA